NIRRMVQIVSALDTSLADSADVKVFQLKYASAASAARLINELFGDQAQGRGNQQQQGFRRFGFFGGGFAGGGGFPGGFQGGGGGGGGDRGGSGGRGGNQQQNQAGRAAVRVNASSDDRTNTVVVAGPPETLQVVE